MEKDLGFGETQHVACLMLTLGYAFDTATIDLGKIAGVIDDKGDHDRRNTTRVMDSVLNCPAVDEAEDGGIKQQSRYVENDKDLKHQGDSADDPDEDLRHIPQRLEAAHGTKGDRQTKRCAENQRHRKDKHRYQEAIK